MSATTKVGAIRMLLDFKTAETVWFVVARTQTPWSDELSPPSESVDTVMLDEIGGLQKAEVVSLCKVDPNGEIEFRGQRYSLVSDSDAYANDARYLYCKTVLRFDTFPLVMFRQYGILVGVIPASGYEDRNILLPDQVSSYGVLVGYVNIPPIVRTAGSKNVLEIVLALVPKMTNLS